VGLDSHQLSCSWGFINWTPAFDSQTFIRPTNLCWYFTRGYKGEQRITKGSWSLDAEWSSLFSLFSVHVAQAPWNTVASTLLNNAFICRPFICVNQPVKYYGTKRFCARFTYLLGSTIGPTGDNKIYYKIRLYNAWFQAPAAVQRRPSFFWDVMYRRSVFSFRRFGTTYWVSFSRVDLTRNLPLKIGLYRLSRNVGNYESTLSNTPEEQRSQRYTVHR
jgi:hypothetical protein